jgi:hypothetical protein
MAWYVWALVVLATVIVFGVVAYIVWVAVLLGRAFTEWGKDE